MTGFFSRHILKKRKVKKKGRDGDTSHLKQFVLSKDINDNIARLKNIMNNNYDIKSRIINIAGTNLQAGIIYIDSLVDEDKVLDHVLKPLTIASSIRSDNKIRDIDFNTIKNSMISTGSVREEETFDKIVLGIMSGDTFITIQGYKKGLIITERDYEGKQFSEPSMEPSIKGAREAFVETLKRNVGLIRKRVRDPNFTIEKFLVGRRTKTDSVIVYMKGIANPDIVDEVRRRFLAIDIDGYSTAIQFGSLMVEKPNSIFPLFQITERPDKLVSALSEGRVAIIMDGSPYCILVPVTLPMLLQSVDDYFENWVAVSVIRFARYIALLISSLFPALYIALTNFNPGMLPTNLILSIAASRSGVPFPAFVEAILMEFTLEILQEAGVRLPRVVGQTVSIVGGLVIGQAAVQAGIVSPIMVIIISVTAVASFTIPDYSLSLASRIIRLPFMALAVTFGSFGIVMGMLLLLTYMASIKSFGIRYLEPISPYRIGDWKDTFLRMPSWMMNRRPEFLQTEDVIRKSDYGTGGGTNEN